jgi:23S rRNA pseudouridine2605 synthase
MAACGVASRRKCENIILDGLVMVNGQVIKELGYKIDPESDSIQVNGVQIVKEKKVYILLHKPTGYVTTVTDPQMRKTVIDLIPEIENRIYPVGRLDYDTSGLLLLTNDGDLANKMTHPSFELEKVYVAKVDGEINEDNIHKLETGIMLEDGITAPAKVTLLNNNKENSFVQLIIHEGRNRQVRRMLEAVGNTVLKLRRERIGFLNLEGLEVGKYRELTIEEINKLKQLFA